jgi:hypothetical protein
LYVVRLPGVFSVSEQRSQGLEPEIVPSEFGEDLPKSGFENVYEYPVANATHKVWRPLDPHKVVRVLRSFNRL